jgi:hypothetical protein
LSDFASFVVFYRGMGRERKLEPTVPPKYSDRSAIIEVDRLSFAPLVGAATPVHRARRSHLDAQDLGP